LDLWKEIRLWHKLKLYNPNIFATWWFKRLIFQQLAFIDIVVRKSEFVTKTQFLCPELKKEVKRADSEEIKSVHIGYLS